MGNHASSIAHNAKIPRHPLWPAPPPANVYWAGILGIVLIAIAATTIVYFRARAALDRAVSAGPELVLAADTPR